MIFASRLRWLSYSLILLVAMMSALYWWKMSQGHEQLRTESLGEVSKRASQLAELQARHMEALYIGIDQSLRQFRNALQTGNVTDAEATAETSLSAFPSGALSGFAVADEKGYIYYFNNYSERFNVVYRIDASPQRYYIGDRDYFQFFERQPQDRLFISKPISGRTSGRWIVPITRPLLKQGRFAGVVVASFSAEYLADMLAKVKLSPNDVGLLLYDDGSYAARSQKLHETLGKSVPPDRPFLSPDSPRNGVYRVADPFDKIARTYAWHKLDGYPLIMIIGLDESVVLDPVEQQIDLDRKHGSIIIGLILLLASVISTLLIRAARQQMKLESNEAMLRSALESTDDGILVTNTSTGNVIDANRRFEELWGVPHDAIADNRFERLLASVVEQLADPEAFLQGIREISETEDEHKDLVRFKDDRIFEYYTSSFFHGEQRARLWSFRDITERKKIQKSLELTQFSVNEAVVPIAWISPDARIQFVNEAACRHLGYSREELLGLTLHDIDPHSTDDSWQEFWNGIKENQFRKFEAVHLAKDGRQIPVEITAKYIRHEGQEYSFAFWLDLSEKKISEDLIWKQANFDVMTGLPNRRMFLDRLNGQINKSRRAGTMMALLFIDLDDFKDINDTLGHNMGDSLLQEAARRLSSCVRSTDTVARMGGDEFTVVLGDMHSAENAERVAREILNKLSSPFRLGDDQVYVSVSVGITLYPDDALTPDDLLKNADQAMYAAKQQGKNRFHYFTPSMQQAAQARMKLINDLRVAVSENQFEIHYQPIVELATGSIHKAEALVRWTHPVHGMISPSEFIPLAEDTGMIVTIGDWMFRKAATQARRLIELHDPRFQISVNKSAVQFRKDSGVYMTWIEYLQQSGMPGNSMVIEITESLLMETDSHVTEQLDAFRRAGIQVSLDDFGTGYSSLSYLKKFEIDYLKIDQAFVRNLAPGSSDMALCEAIIVMAHKLGIKVIAEGVETEEQRDLLADAGCDYAQGYLFSRPVPADSFESFLGISR